MCFAEMLGGPEEPAIPASSPVVLLPPIKVPSLHPAPAAGTAPLITMAHRTAPRKNELSSSWAPGAGTASGTVSWGWPVGPSGPWWPRGCGSKPWTLQLCKSDCQLPSAPKLFGFKKNPKKLVLFRLVLPARTQESVPNGRNFLPALGRCLNSWTWGHGLGMMVVVLGLYWTLWSWRSLPTQMILWFCDSCDDRYGHFWGHLVFIQALSFAGAREANWHATAHDVVLTLNQLCQPTAQSSWKYQTA